MPGSPSKPSTPPPAAAPAALPGPPAAPVAPAPSAPTAKPVSKPRPDTKQPWLWNVVLLDDQDHTYEYVIRMMQSLFGHTSEGALQVAKAVDAEGRAICTTVHKELAELKRDQILAFGKDALMAQCKGSMSAVIEPAVGG